MRLANILLFQCIIEGKRYLYPLTYSAPLILMWLMYVVGFKNKDTHELNDSHNNHEINN